MSFEFGDDRAFRLFAIRQLMRDDVTEPMNLDALARHAGMSTFHFLRLFRKTFRETPHQLAIEFRLARAKELLMETNLPITEICFECGYESLGSFSHLFRREVGYSPREFRANRRRFWPVNIASICRVAPFCLLDGFGFGTNEKQFSRSIAAGTSGILTTETSNPKPSLSLAKEARGAKVSE